MKLVGKRWTIKAYPNGDPGLGLVLIGLAGMPTDEALQSRFAESQHRPAH